MTSIHNNDAAGDLQVPIYRKTYEFMKTFYQFSFDFPKKDRYTLGSRCEGYILDILEHVIIATQTSGDEKRTTLNNASVRLDLLKVYVRLAYELKVLSGKRYIICQNYMQEIGRMLGGWIRATSKQ